MAGTTGPLFSLEASGTVGKTITYSRWKGRSYVRRRVIPLNPYEAGQVAARNMIRAFGNIQTWMNHETYMSPTATERDKLKIRAITPDDQAWNGFLVKSGIGANADVYTAAQALWATLAANHGDWDDAADGLHLPIQPASQGIAGGGAGVALTSGNVFFLARYALYVMGLAAIPGAVPPTYVAA